MALIKCPECGKKVSSVAKVCPDCGFPIAENSSAGTVSIKISNGLAGTVKVYDVGNRGDKVLWKGRAGQVATFNVEEETTIDITWGLNDNPSPFSQLATKVKGNEKYELTRQQGLLLSSMVLNRVDIIDSGR